MPMNDKQIDRVDIIARVSKDRGVEIEARARLAPSGGGRHGRYTYSHTPTQGERDAIKSIVSALARDLGIQVPEWIQED